MSEGILTWQQIAAANANTSDAINWQEFQSPDTVNNSARNMMAETARYIADVAGVRDADRVMVTTGAPNAHVIDVTNLAMVPPALTNGWELTFVAGVGLTNTGAATFSPDGMNPKPIRCKTGVDMTGGEIVEGQVYTCVYHKTDDEWLMKSGGGFSVPFSLVATIAEIRSAVPNKVIDTDGFWGAPFPVALPDAAAAANINIDFATGLNFRVTLLGTNAKLNTILGGKPGQAGVIEITATGGNYALLKNNAVWRGVASEFPLTVQNGTTAFLYYSIVPSAPGTVIVTGIINNPG